jgi:hypothetical protein
MSEGKTNLNERIKEAKMGESEVTWEFKVRAIHVSKVPGFAEVELYHKACFISVYTPLALGSEFECMCIYRDSENTPRHKRYRIVQIFPLKIIEVKK